MEPRSKDDIISDLLLFAEEHQWSGQINTACHCHPKYKNSCPGCGNLDDPYRRGGGEHKHDCHLMLLIKEARAMLLSKDD